MLPGATPQPLPSILLFILAVEFLQAYPRHRESVLIACYGGPYPCNWCYLHLRMLAQLDFRHNCRASGSP